jgi:hypothetical protein
LDIANVFDVWIWAILLSGVAALALAGRARVARLTLAALLVFEGIRVAAHARAIDMMSAQWYEGAPPQRITALPGAFNPLVWRGVVEYPGRVVTLTANVVKGVGAQTVYPVAPPLAAMDAALRTPPFQVFSEWSQLPFWKVTSVEEGTRLDLIDLRFGAPDRPGFASVSAIVDRTGKVLRAGFGI